MNDSLQMLPSQIELLQTCPVCGKRGSTSLAMPDVRIGDEHFKEHLPHLALVKCLHCGLIYVNPRPTPDYLMTFYESPGYVHHAQGYGRIYDSGRRVFWFGFIKGA